MDEQSARRRFRLTLADAAILFPLVYAPFSHDMFWIPKVAVLGWLALFATLRLLRGQVRSLPAWHLPYALFALWASFPFLFGLPAAPASPFLPALWGGLFFLTALARLRSRPSGATVPLVLSLLCLGAIGQAFGLDVFLTERATGVSASRMATTLGHPQYLGQLIVLLWPYALLCPSQRLRAASLLLASTALLLSFSRVSWLAVLAQALLWGRARTALRTKYISVVAIGLCLSLGMLLALGKTQELFDRFDFQREVYRGTLSNRSLYSLVGWTMWKEHPLAGIGYGSYGYRYYENLAHLPREVRLDFVQRELAVEHPVAPHVEPVQILAETGLVGLLLWGWMIASLFLGLRREPAGSPVGSGREAGYLSLTGFCLCALFSFPFHDLTLWIPAAALWTVWGPAGAFAAEGRLLRASRPALLASASALAVLGTQIFSAHVLLRAAQRAADREPLRAERLFNASLAFIRLGETHYYYARWLQGGGRLTEAHRHLREAVQLTSNPTVWLHYARLTLKLGAWEESIAAFEHLSRCVVWKPFLLESHEVLATLYHEKGDEAAAARHERELAKLQDSER